VVYISFGLYDDEVYYLVYHILFVIDKIQTSFGQGPTPYVGSKIAPWRPVI